MRYYKVYYYVPELKSKALLSLIVEAKNEKHAYMKFRNNMRERWVQGLTRVVDKIVES